MFIIEWRQDGAWSMERGDYFVHDSHAVTEAKRRTKADGAARRVMTWPAPLREVWPTKQEPTSEAA